MKTTQEKRQKLELARQKAQAWAIKKRIKSKEKKIKSDNQVKARKTSKEKFKADSIEDTKLKSDRAYKQAQAHSETLEITLQNLTKQRDSLNKSIAVIKERLKEVKSEESTDQPL